MQGGRQGAALFGALIFWLILPVERDRIKRERHMCLSICAVPAQMIRDYKKGGADMGDKPPEKGPAAGKPTAAG